MNNQRQLAQFLYERFVYTCFGDFDGMNENPSLVDLLTLQSLVTLAIAEKQKE